MQRTPEKDVSPVIIAIVAEIVGAVRGSERTQIGDMLRYGGSHLLTHAKYKYKYKCKNFSSLIGMEL